MVGTPAEYIHCDKVGQEEEGWGAGASAHYTEPGLSGLQAPRAGNPHFSQRKDCLTSWNGFLDTFPFFNGLKAPVIEETRKGKVSTNCSAGNPILARGCKRMREDARRATQIVGDGTHVQFSNGLWKIHLPIICYLDSRGNQKDDAG